MRDFNRFYDELLRYQKEHGDLYVPATYTVEGYHLGDKVHHVRTGMIVTNSEEKQKLDQIGFAWKVRNDYPFHYVYRLLALYKAKNGNCDIPLEFKTKSGIPLGRIMRNIRIGWKKVSESQANKLKSIGFLLDPATVYMPQTHREKAITRKVEGRNLSSIYQVATCSASTLEDAIVGLEEKVNQAVIEGYDLYGTFTVTQKDDIFYVCQPLILVD